MGRDGDASFEVHFRGLEGAAADTRPVIEDVGSVEGLYLLCFIRDMFPGQGSEISLPDLTKSRPRSRRLISFLWNG